MTQNSSKSVTLDNQPRFSSKIAMILTCMGMAVGTGNIWRFPREVAKHDGGTFLIPWIIFLFLWSVPLLMVELSIGQHTRKGPFGAFAKLGGRKLAWMGGFISICTMLIMCYYAVVTGWTLKYLILAWTGQLNGIGSEQSVALFDSFRSTPQALFFHVAALLLGGFFVYRGTKGIEWLNKILIPALILILIIGAVNALLLPNAGVGLQYLFDVDASKLMSAEHWIAGLTQSAWSTGAGWGLMLSYAVYARDDEDPITTPMATGSGNNGIELIVALLIFPATFALMTQGAAYISGASSKGGIAFQVIPLLFGQMEGGPVLNILFFSGLAFAALTSLVAMLELSTRFFMDFGVPRRRAIVITLVMAILIGAPSALSDKIFDDQDFVWAVGLIVSGLFLNILVWIYGPAKFAGDMLDRNPGFIKPGKWFTVAMGLVLVEGLVLLGWWLYQMAGSGWRVLASCLFQFAIVIGALWLLNDRLVKRVKD
ncbi:Sodium-dependent transporter [Sulfidibacter corallicola]|uniref:Sodium-dependent transporter n=1 Tax=Sulfidibacter corallicola TaxID=2818388 RepID=A0A8A4TRD9_SULCO|nr:sodium-dependent transporter [Sulfidibacter corallicola]QTD51652.1 sodium-dependent transporter [Sulfidibacter corallicola]